MDLKTISLSSIFNTFLEKGLRLKKAKNSFLDKIDFVLSGNFGEREKITFFPFTKNTSTETPSPGLFSFPVIEAERTAEVLCGVGAILINQQLILSIDFHHYS